jgi:hypothetical protein
MSGQTVTKSNVSKIVKKKSTKVSPKTDKIAQFGFDKELVSFLKYLSCEPIDVYKSGAVQFSKVLINHDIAKYILDNYNIGNRDIDNNEVKKFATLMMKNQWYDNGVSLGFDRSGRLVDGQHRLKAITYTKDFEDPKEIEFGIFVKSKDWDCTSQDNGKRRSFGDYAKIASNDPNHHFEISPNTPFSKIESAFNHALKIKKKQYAGLLPMPNDEKLDYYMKHFEGLDKSIIFINEMYGGRNKIFFAEGCGISAPQIMAIHFFFHRIDSQMANFFMENVLYGPFNLDPDHILYRAMHTGYQAMIEKDVPSKKYYQNNKFQQAHENYKKKKINPSSYKDSKRTRVTKLYFHAWNRMRSGNEYSNKSLNFGYFADVFDSPVEDLK